MKSIKFKNSVEIKASHDSAESLHLIKINSFQGEVVTCQYLNFWERIRVLLNGKIWISQITYNKDFYPSKYSTKQKEIIIINDKYPIIL